MTTTGDRGLLPGGGAPVDVAGLLAFLEQEYLHGYVAGGGSAIKILVVGSEDVSREISHGLAEIGEDFVHLATDAAGTRVHMVDQVFAAIARQVDWIALASAVVSRAYDRSGYPAPSGSELSVAAVAKFHDCDPNELYRSVRRVLERSVLDDVTLSHEFRVAMLRLCQERLGRGDVEDTERETVIAWLGGEKLPIGALRRVGLHTRVTRHSARPMLVSLTRWVRRAGGQGVILQLDLERLAVSRRPPAGLRDGFYYSKAAVLDAYEVIRQLIDATDDLEGLLVAVLLPPELVTDDSRGLPAYAALHLRVADEVRDHRRPNPYAAMVRVGVRLEAVR
jgi:P-loop Domain of unknown function (DUF2791)